MFQNLNLWTRKLHRWGAVLCALPMIVVIGSGLFLQLKKEVSWIQPPTQTGETSNVAARLTLAALLDITRSVPEADVEDWDDIDRIDVRPSKGIAKVRCNNRWEVQIDLANGNLLSSTYRRSDLIESLHDGSFFSDAAKLWIFLPNGLILLGLWITGMWLWYLPFRSRRRKSKRAASAA